MSAGRIAEVEVAAGGRPRSAAGCGSTSTSCPTSGWEPSSAAAAASVAATTCAAPADVRRGNEGRSTAATVGYVVSSRRHLRPCGGSSGCGDGSRKLSLGQPGLGPARKPAPAKRTRPRLAALAIGCSLPSAGRHLEGHARGGSTGRRSGSGGGSGVARADKGSGGDRRGGAELRRRPARRHCRARRCGSQPTQAARNHGSRAGEVRSASSARVRAAAAAGGTTSTARRDARGGGAGSCQRGFDGGVQFPRERGTKDPIRSDRRYLLRFVLRWSRQCWQLCTR